MRVSPTAFAKSAAGVLDAASWLSAIHRDSGTSDRSSTAAACGNSRSNWRRPRTPRTPRSFSELMTLQAAGLRGSVERMNQETVSIVTQMRRPHAGDGSAPGGRHPAPIPVTGLN